MIIYIYMEIDDLPIQNCDFPWVYIYIKYK